MSCKRCGSWAINHEHHGRDGSEPNLCDVCYWRNRTEAKDAELAGYVEANRHMKGELDDALEDARKYCAAKLEIARLKDGERKYAAALTKDQGDIDWRKWMLVPVTECEFIPKAKHDAETARLSSALKSAAAFLTWCLEETPIGKPPEIGPDVLTKCRAALAQEPVE